MLKVHHKSQGKIIISGEYSVLFEQPAIVYPTSYYAETFVQEKKGITIGIDDFGITINSTIGQIMHWGEVIFKRYESFQKGDIAIESVLLNIEDLFVYILYRLSPLIPNLDNVQTNIKSMVPIGCGMGSSAACIISFIRAIFEFFNIGVENFQLFLLGREIENLVHGLSSGLDIMASIRGEPIFYYHEQFKSIMSPSFPLYIINTGKPLADTGTCVMFVTQNYSRSDIWSEMGSLTDQIAHEGYDAQKFNELIRMNHRYLCELGVVPQKVQDFISKIEKRGGAAKICGAGSISGDNAGIVISTSDEFCAEYGYQLY